MTSSPPSRPRATIRPTDEGAWIAVALIALLAAAIVACLALATLYFQVALATDSLIG